VRVPGHGCRTCFPAAGVEEPKLMYMRERGEYYDKEHALRLTMFRLSYGEDGKAGIFVLRTKKIKEKRNICVYL
jgi:hypothetical protein